MATLRESVKNMQSNCCLTDDNKDLHTFRKTTDNIGRSLAQIRDATKVWRKQPIAHCRYGIVYCGYQNPSVFCFLMFSRAIIAIQAPWGKTKEIVVVVVE